MNWNNFGITVVKELVNNLWELKDSAQNFVDRNPQNKKVIEYANHIISYYNNVRSKLLILKTEIDNYNKKFPNNKIKNIEELTDSKIKSSIMT